MPVTNYISVNGRMLSEITDGVILDYVPDALGSIHSVVDQTATAVKTMRYKPYGEVLSRSGSISDRMYQWVGTYGYRATFNYASSHYVRARHYSQIPGSWTTVDPLWPDENAYVYAVGRPTATKDQTGLKCGIQGHPHNPDPPKPCRDLLPKGDFEFDKNVQDFLRCMTQKGNSKEGINECFRDYGNNIKNEQLDKLRDFLACILGSRTDPGLAGGKNPCDPPNSRWGQSCCYMRFLKCLFDCKTGGGFADVNVCIGKCHNSFSGKRDGKGGFTECLAIAGPGEGGYIGPPAFVD